MKESIRKHRRDRYLKRQELRRLDELAEKKLRLAFYCRYLAGVARAAQTAALKSGLIS